MTAHLPTTPTERADLKAKLATQPYLQFGPLVPHGASVCRVDPDPRGCKYTGIDPTLVCAAINLLPRLLEDLERAERAVHPSERNLELEADLSLRKESLSQACAELERLHNVEHERDETSKGKKKPNFVELRALVKRAKDAHCRGARAPATSIAITWQEMERLLIYIDRL